MVQIFFQEDTFSLLLWDDHFKLFFLLDCQTKKNASVFVINVATSDNSLFFSFLAKRVRPEGPGY